MLFSFNLLIYYNNRNQSEKLETKTSYNAIGREENEAK